MMGLMDVAHWIESHPGSASWIQAGGSLVALVVAILIPWKAGRRQQQQALAAAIVTSDRIVHRIIQLAEEAKARHRGQDVRTSRFALNLGELSRMLDKLNVEQLASEHIDAIHGLAGISRRVTDIWNHEFKQAFASREAPDPQVLEDALVEAEAFRDTLRR